MCKGKALRARVLILPLLVIGFGPAESQVARDPSRLDVILQRAVDAADAVDFAVALELYQELEGQGDSWYGWAGTSGQVAIHRMLGSGESARAITARVAAERPNLSGLMAIWDGDTAESGGTYRKIGFDAVKFVK